MPNSSASKISSVSAANFAPAPQIAEAQQANTDMKATQIAHVVKGV